MAIAQTMTGDGPRRAESVGLRIEPFPEASRACLERFEARNARDVRLWSLADEPSPRGTRFLARDAGGAIVASGQLQRADHLGHADGERLIHVVVEPGARGRGLGGALLERLESAARDAGASRLLSILYADQPDGLRCAERHGYAEYDRRSRWFLELARYPAARFGDPAQLARRTGTEIRSLASLIDEGRLDDSLAMQIADAHFALIAEMRTVLPVREPVTDYRRGFLETSRVVREASFVALRGRELAALTLIVRVDPRLAFVAISGAVGPGRGRKLTLPLKVHAIEALQSLGFARLGSLYDADHAAGRVLNRALGFEAEPAMVRVQKRLADRRA